QSLKPNPVLNRQSWLAHAFGLRSALIGFLHLLFIGFAPSNSHNNNCLFAPRRVATHRTPKPRSHEVNTTSWPSNDRAIPDHGILRNEDNAIANIIRAVLRIGLNHFCL